MIKFTLIALCIFSHSNAFAAKTTFLLIRHGETNWNAEKRWQGQADIPLNKKGRTQAKRVAKKLFDEHPDLAAIYSSDLSRALDTSKETARLFNLPVVARSDLREYTVGVAEGLLYQEVIDRFGSWETLSQKYPDKRERWKHSQVPGQETIYQTTERLKKALCAIAAKHPDKKVAIFTHGGCLKTIVADLEDLESIDEVPTPNCGILQIVYESDNTEQPLRVVYSPSSEKQPISNNSTVCMQ